MKLTFNLVILFVLIATNSWADRVLIRKADGMPIEYQTGDAALGTLAENAIASGYQKDAIEERYISGEEYLKLKKEKIDDPKQADIDKIKDAAINNTKKKLNLSDNDLADLKKALQ